MATKESIYEAQLKELGIFEEAYRPAIKELCILERELSRARRKLKAKHTEDGKRDEYAYFTDPMYGIIKQIQASVLAYKDALGLTPKSLKKLRGKNDNCQPCAQPAVTPLSMISRKRDDRKSASPA